jgi:hypothetical protein
MHNNTLNTLAEVYGVTNGHGARRRPWVAQFAAAAGDCMQFYVQMFDTFPKMRAIAGDGSIYISGDILWIIAPVTGWITVEVDIPGDTEKQFKFVYALVRPGVDVCGSGNPPH